MSFFTPSKYATKDGVTTCSAMSTNLFGGFSMFASNFALVPAVTHLLKS